MRQPTQKSHTADVLFTLALFCVFAVSALAVVLVGADVYKRTAAGMETSFTSRTAVSYVAQKVRQSDESGAVSLTQMGGETALRLSRRMENGDYFTYIYYYDGSLRELFCAADLTPSPEMGQPLLELDSFSIERAAQKGCLAFTATGADGETSRLILSLKSA